MDCNCIKWTKKDYCVDSFHITVCRSFMSMIQLVWLKQKLWKSFRVLALLIFESFIVNWCLAVPWIIIVSELFSHLWWCHTVYEGWQKRHQKCGVVKPVSRMKIELLNLLEKQVKRFWFIKKIYYRSVLGIYYLSMQKNSLYT